MIDPIGTFRHIYQRVNQIFYMVNAILTLTETGGTVATTVINTEYDIYINETPLGAFSPKKVQIDFSAQTVNEIVIVRLYHRINPTGDKEKKDELAFDGVQEPVLKNIKLEPNRYGVRVSIERIAGDSKSYDWCVFYKV